MRRADHETIQQVLDGSISQQDFVEFQQRMRTEPGFSKLYGDYALLHHSLCEEFEGQPVSHLPVPVRRPAPAVGWWIAAAAVVLMAGVVFYQKRSPVAAPPSSVAEVRFSADAVWQIDGDTGKTGGGVAKLPLGATLQLLQGQADLSPHDKASALIVGPSSLTFVSPDSLHLADGRGRFRLEDPAGKLEVTTPSLSAVDLGTEFGIESHRDQPDELHVIDGKVQLRINGKTDSQILVTGEAARISGADSIERFKADPDRFPKRLAEFKAVLGGSFVKSEWRVEYGKPSISADGITGVNYTVFRSLSENSPSGENPVLLASLAVESPSAGQFHTDGWAGMSFFNKGVELLFFGDSFGPERTWSLDVKQRIPVILPGNPVVGPRTVTLRYDHRTGEVSLHAGAVPLGAPFCSGKLPAGTVFDEIRLGASSSAALAVRSLVIQVGGGQ